MLKGKRVTLRALEREDLKRLHEMNQREVELNMLAGDFWELQSFVAFEKRFERQLEAVDAHEFVIEVDGKVIGIIGLQHVRRRSNCTEFGIAIFDPEYLNKGYGRESIELLLDYAFRIQNFRRVWLEVSGNNPRAIRAYATCGFIEEGRLREHAFTNGQFVDVLVMGMLRTEWESRQNQ